MLRSWILLAIIAALGVGGAALAAGQVFQQTAQVEQLRLERAVLAHRARLQAHLSSRQTIVEAVAAASEPNDPMATDTLDDVDAQLLETMPDAYSFVWVPRVPRDQHTRVLAALAAAGIERETLLGPEGQALPASELPPTLFPVLDIQPKTEENQQSLALNLNSLPLPAEALARAEETQRAAATAPLELVQSPGQPAVVVYAPVYSREKVHLGFVGMSFHYQRLISAGVDEDADLPFAVSIRDSGDADARLLYAAGEGGDGPGLERRLSFGGRSLLVSYRPFMRPELAAAHRALMTGMGLILLWLIVFGATLLLVRANQRANEALAARMQAEERLRTLVDELNHRVRNMLTVVQAVARWSLKPEAHRDIDAARETLLSRLGAIANATSLLSNENWRGASMLDLVHAALISGARRTEIEGPPLLAAPNAAQMLSLLLYELWTNATKHGALASENGRVAIRWSVENGMFRLVWRERGGRRGDASKGAGFGSQLTTVLAPRALNGEASAEFDEEGLIYTLSAPLANVVQTASPSDSE